MHLIRPESTCVCCGKGLLIWPPLWTSVTSTPNNIFTQHLFAIDHSTFHHHTAFAQQVAAIQSLTDTLAAPTITNTLRSGKKMPSPRIGRAPNLVPWTKFARGLVSRFLAVQATASHPAESCRPPDRSIDRSAGVGDQLIRITRNGEEEQTRSSYVFYSVCVVYLSRTC